MIIIYEYENNAVLILMATFSFTIMQQAVPHTKYIWTGHVRHLYGLVVFLIHHKSHIFQRGFWVAAAELAEFIKHDFSN